MTNSIYRGQKTEQYINNISRMKWNQLTAVRFQDALTIAKFDLFGTP